MKKYTVIIIGAGGRGHRYARIIKDLPDKFEVVAVAEPIKARRDSIQKLFNLPDSACFLGYEEILAQPKMADVAAICTMDDMHTEPALKAIELG